jgi:hypothetical protein
MEINGCSLGFLFQFRQRARNRKHRGGGFGGTTVYGRSQDHFYDPK